MINPCDRCHAARFCTRRCYTWKDYHRSKKKERTEECQETEQKDSLYFWMVSKILPELRSKDGGR